jgi:hypothetical protein
VIAAVEEVPLSGLTAVRERRPVRHGLGTTHRKKHPRDARARSTMLAPHSMLELRSRGDLVLLLSFGAVSF